MKTTKKKLNPNARKWVRALRSGKYKQTAGTLHRVRKGEHRFCCLGVACEIYNQSAKRKLKVGKHHKDTISYDGEADVLPQRVKNWLGLADDTGMFGGFNSLAAKNDARVKFPKIADIIEAQPEGLFA